MKVARLVSLIGGVPLLTPSLADGVLVQMANQVSERFRVRHYRIEARSRFRKFAIPDEAPDAAFVGQNLVDGHDEHERGAVEPLPGFQVRGVPRVAFPSRLV